MRKDEVEDAKVALRAQGYTVVRSKLNRFYLKELGFNPQSVFDVGVNRGTPWLYAAYPNSQFILVDPRDESLRKTRERFPSVNMSCFTCAAGADEKSVELLVASQGGRSSVYSRTKLTKSAVSARRTVPVRRLDEIRTAAKARPPFGIKIDTEGYEIEVIKGAQETLKETEFIISEISIKNRFVGGYRFSGMILAMKNSGFELLDFLNYRRVPPAYVDCLFVRAESKLFSKQTSSLVSRHLAGLFR